MGNTLQGATVDNFLNVNALRSSAKNYFFAKIVLQKSPSFTYWRLLRCPLFTYSISDQMEQIL
jgi:hypothetical protein